MKRFLTCFFLICAVPAFSLKVNNIEKHSIGIVLSPVQIVCWQAISYSELNSNGPNRLYLAYGSPSGISNQFKPINFLSLRAGIISGYERLVYR